MKIHKSTGGIEERVYSVTMTENELKLFSEFLEEQKEYSLVKSAAKFKKHLLNTIKPTEAGKRLTRMKTTKNLKDPFWHEMRRREIIAPYGVELPSNYMI